MVSISVISRVYDCVRGVQVGKVIWTLNFVKKLIDKEHEYLRIIMRPSG